MTQSTTAIFENGSFRPIKPVTGIPEHAIVRLNIETVETYTKQEILAMLAAVPVDDELADSIEQGRNRPWRVEKF